MTVQLEPKKAEFKALATWMEDKNKTPLEDIARNHNINPAEFRRLISETYTICTNVAITYHSDRNGEYSHGGAADEAGIDLWTYIYFRMKYGVYHDQSEEGLRHAKKLKESDLYNLDLL